MKLDKSKYIVQELVDKGLVAEDKLEEALKIVNEEAKFNKEYQIKKQIVDYLERYSICLINEEDVENIYSVIKSKFKEDVELTVEDIKAQVYNYLVSKGKYTPINVLVEERFKPISRSIFYTKTY